MQHIKYSSLLPVCIIMILQSIWMLPANQDWASRLFHQLDTFTPDGRQCNIHWLY